MILNYKQKITTQQGQIVDASAPVIISASRSTDIPAFYSDWFINRLKVGYVVWKNPFNQQPMYISFKNTKVIVFWTKNPKPLIPLLHELDDMGIHYYFQFTLNDYDDEGFEPNVPNIEQKVETFRQLSQQIGKERVIWRFDPLIVTPKLSPHDLLIKIWNLGNQLEGFTNKLVFSFIDINEYRKVRSNLIKDTVFFSKDTIEKAELSQEQMHEIACGLAKCRDRWKSYGWDIELATCGEQIDLTCYNISHNRCIDGELMKNLWSDDMELIHFLNYGRLPEKDTLFGEEVNLKTLSPEMMKDQGQRKVCGCMVSKDIGQYNTCPHQCTYCYANSSKELVMKNWQKHLNNPLSATIIGL